MYADLSDHPGCRRILCNPAWHISKVIRQTIGFGKKEYFVPRQDGIQEYLLDEGVCAAFEKAIEETVRPQADKHRDYAVFSIHDELIGPEGILENMVVCQQAGYKVLLEDKGGHRLCRQSLRFIKEVIAESV